jgi:ubiquinone/menaquinone biosynthesis C-methylase UbiE
MEEVELEENIMLSICRKLGTATNDRRRAFIIHISNCIISNPMVYDLIQYIAGVESIKKRLIPYIMITGNLVVIDVGAGTGNYARLMPPSVTYLWLDNDTQKLQGFKTKSINNSSAILGDATRLCLKNKSVDYALCIALAHHLTDTQLRYLFSELARVVKLKLIFLDAVEHRGSKLSALLWKYDRGSHPRSKQDIISELELWYEIENLENFKIYHHYILCACVPRSRPLVHSEC